MASSTPSGPNDPKRLGGHGKKRSWLSTDEWLDVSPDETPPPQEPSGELPLLPDLPSDSTILSKSELADMHAAADDEEAIDLATPPDGIRTGPPSLSKILKATGTKSDILRATQEQDQEQAGKQSSPASKLAKNLHRSTSQASPSSESSDIFSSARNDSSHPQVNTGGDSDLFGGLPDAADRGSSMFDDTGKRTRKIERPASENSDVFRAAEATGGDPSAVPLHGEFPGQTSGPPSSVQMAERLLSGLSSDSGEAATELDFNLTDKSPGGSNLFDDVTAMDINLDAPDPSGTSAVNWADPNQSHAQESSPGSSIFNKTKAEAGAAEDRVDLSHIPMMGSTDDPAEMVQPSDLSGPTSSILKQDIDKVMSQLRNQPGAISFDMDDDKAAWKVAAAQRDQHSMQMPVSDDELELAAMARGPVQPKSKKDSDSVFDESFNLPDDSGVLYRNVPPPESGSILPGVNSDELAQPAELDAAIAVASTRVAKARPRTTRPDWVTVGACLLLGTFAGASGMYMAIPSDASKPIASTPRDPKPVAALGASQLLASGDPHAALKALEGNSDESPEFKAVRGQARWLSILRDAAAKNDALKANDLELQMAQADLRSVAESAADYTLPKQQQAAAQAGLHLGLIEEALGRPADAVKVYRSMAAKLPMYQRVFETAAQRTSIMRTRPDGAKVPDAQYTLAPHEVLNLAGAGSILFAFDPVQELDDEPGFAFWEAVNLAVTPGELDKAIAAISKARQSHEIRRRIHAGRGLNPFTDPSEQMFLRACDELAAYWSLKQAVYGAAGGDVAGKTPTGILEDLAAAKIAAGDSAERIAKANAELKRAVENAQQYQTAREQAETALADVHKEAEALRKINEDQKATLTSTQEAMSDLKQKLAAADQAIDPLIAELKGLKLIDAQATREQAIAALPEAARKAASMGDTTGRTAELAKELAALKEQSKADLAQAEKKANDLVARAEADRKAMEEDVRKFRDRADAAMQAVRDERAALERKIRELTEAYQRQLAAVRAGAAVAFSTAEQESRDAALREYGLGLDAYFAARYADAEKHFTAASDRNPGDARFWYFLGLAKLAQGSEAEVMFRRGTAQESLGMPRRSLIDADLVRVQGNARAALERARP